MRMPPIPAQVFCFSAPKDIQLLKQLEQHLTQLQYGGLITLSQISPGDGEDTILAYINTASLILLLITPNFMTSRYYYGPEMQRAMQRHEANEAQIIPL